MKSFLTKIVDAFEVDSGDVRFGTFRFSDEYEGTTTRGGMTVVHHLNTYNKAADIKQAIMAMPYSEGGTDTGR